MKREILELRDVSVKEGQETLLQDIHLCLYEGETIGICGFHGVGKTTLAQVLSGRRAVTEGKIFWKEQLLSVHDTACEKLLSEKVSHIYALPDQMNDFTVYDYLIAMRPAGPKRFLYRKKAAQHQARYLLTEAGIDLDPSLRMDDLNRQQKFMLQVVKSASYGAQVIILDEVAMAFPAAWLREFLERMKKIYGLSFIYICSMYDETAEEADRLYIMRERSLVYTICGQESGASVLEKTAVDYTNAYRKRSRRIAQERETVFRVGFSVRGGRASSAAAEDQTDVHLEIRQGEITGILCLDTELKRSITELFTESFSAAFFSDGQRITSQETFRRAGGYVIRESAQRDGFFETLSLQDNVLITAVKRYCKARVLPNRRILRYLWKQTARPYLGDSESGVTELTNVNRIRILLLRVQVLQPKLVILDNITLYLDPIEREEILRMLQDFADQGTAFLLLSSGFQEVYSMCERVLMLRKNGEWALYRAGEDSYEEASDFLQEES